MHLVFRLTHKPLMLDRLPPVTAYYQLNDIFHIAVHIASFDCSTRPVPSIGRVDETLQSKMAAVRAVGGRRLQKGTDVPGGGGQILTDT